MTVPTRPVVTLEARGAPHAADANLVRGIFTTATSRSFTQSITDPGSATFTLRYYEPDTNRQPSHDLALLDPTNCDILFWAATDYGPQCLFRGRLTAVSVQANAGGDIVVQCQVTDYKGLLSQRILFDADCQKLVNSDGSPGVYQRNYAAGVDLASIVWDVIRITQARTSGTLGISSSGTGIPSSPTTMTTTTATIPSTGTTGTVWRGGNGASGIPTGHVTEFPTASSLGDLISSIAAGNQGTYDFGSGPVGTQGFEWDIVPNITTGNLQVWVWPKANTDGRGRGLDNRWVLDYGGSVATFTTDWSTDRLGTAIRLSVGPGTIQRTIDVSSQALGRWERAVPLANPFPTTFANPFPIVQDRLDKLAAQAFFEDTSIKFAYTVTQAPAIDPTSQLSVALGDTATVQVPTLSGTSNEVVRVIGRTVEVSDNGDVTVTLALGRLPIFTTGARARAQKSLSAQVHRLQKSMTGGSY